VFWDEDNKETVAQGMGELHLDIYSQVNIGTFHDVLIFDLYHCKTSMKFARSTF